MKCPYSGYLVEDLTAYSPNPLFREESDEDIERRRRAFTAISVGSVIQCNCGKKLKAVLRGNNFRVPAHAFTPKAVAAVLRAAADKLTAVDLKKVKAAVARVVALPHPKLATAKDAATRQRLSEENKVTVSQTDDEDEAGSFKVFRLTWGNLRTDQEKALKAALMDLGLEAIGLDIIEGRYDWKTTIEVVEAGRVPQQREAIRWWQKNAA